MLSSFFSTAWQDRTELVRSTEGGGRAAAEGGRSPLVEDGDIIVELMSLTSILGYPRQMVPVVLQELLKHAPGFVRASECFQRAYSAHQDSCVRANVFSARIFHRARFSATGQILSCSHDFKRAPVCARSSLFVFPLASKCTDSQ